MAVVDTTRLRVQGLSEASRRLVVCAVAFGWLMVSCLMLYGAFAVPIYNPDHSVFWTAAKVVITAPSRLYDVEYLTAAQHWLIVGNPRPWAYPPSAILVFLPFGQLPFWVSLAVWNTVSLSVYWLACRKLVFGWALALSLLAPPIARSIYAGQISLIVAALAIGGLAHARDRPLFGGALLGIGAALKPQLFLFAPLMLDKRALLGFCAAVGTMVLVSFAFGPQLWLDWVRALPLFTSIVAEMGIMDRGVSPLSTAAWLGLQGGSAVVLQVVGIAAGILLALWARNKEVEARLFGLIAAGILCSPYAMFYDLAPLVPIAAASLLTARTTGIIQGLPIMFTGAPITFPVAVAAFVWGRRSMDRASSAAGARTACESDETQREQEVG